LVLVPVLELRSILKLAAAETGVVARALGVSVRMGHTLVPPGVRWPKGWTCIGRWTRGCMVAWDRRLDFSVM